MKLIKNDNNIRIPKLYLSQELLSEISYCHHKVGNKEWSGILLYKFEDPTITIEDLYNTKKTEEVKITAHKFLLRDIGSSALTEFDSSNEEIMEQFEYVENGFKCGLIHTHHSMDSFFSGTDNQELLDNAGNHQIYLSLIVNYNNGGRYVARVAWKGVIERKIQQYENHFFSFFKKKNSVKRKIEETETEDVVFYIDIPIEYLVDENLKAKYEELQESNTFTSTIANRYASNTNNVRQLSVAFEKDETDDFDIPSFILEKKDEDFPYVFYRQQAERISKYWESNNFQTSCSFSKDNINKFLTTLVTANKKDTRSFWQLNNAQTNMSVAARTKLEDELEFSFDKTMWDIFNTQLDEVEELFLCYRVLYELPNTVHKKPLHEIVEKFFIEKEDFLIEGMYEEYMESTYEDDDKEVSDTYTATHYGRHDTVKCVTCEGKGRLEEGGYRGICHVCFGDGVIESCLVD